MTYAAQVVETDVVGLETSDMAAVQGTMIPVVRERVIFSAQEKVICAKEVRVIFVE